MRDKERHAPFLAVAAAIVAEVDMDVVDMEEVDMDVVDTDVVVMADMDDKRFVENIYIQ